VVGSLPPRLTELAPESIHPLTRQFELASLKLSLVAQVRFTPATNKDYQGQQANGTGSKAETSIHTGCQVPILGGNNLRVRAASPDEVGCGKLQAAIRLSPNHLPQARVE